VSSLIQISCQLHNFDYTPFSVLFHPLNRWTLCLTLLVSLLIQITCQLHSFYFTSFLFSSPLSIDGPRQNKTPDGSRVNKVLLPSSRGNEFPRSNEFFRAISGSSTGSGGTCKSDSSGSVQSRASGPRSGPPSASSPLSGPRSGPPSGPHSVNLNIGEAMCIPTDNSFHMSARGRQNSSCGKNSVSQKDDKICSRCHIKFCISLTLPCGRVVFLCPTCTSEFRAYLGVKIQQVIKPVEL